MFGVFKTSQIKKKDFTNQSKETFKFPYKIRQLIFTISNFLALCLTWPTCTAEPLQDHLGVFIHHLHTFVSNLKGVIHESGVLLQIRKSKTDGKY